MWDVFCSLLALLFETVIDHAGWLVMNVAVPVFSPFLVIALIRVYYVGSKDPDTGPKAPKLSFWNAVEDGQLFWTSMALLAATAYEAANYALSNTQLPPKMASSSLWFIFGFALLTLVISSICVALVTAHQAKDTNGHKSFIWLSIIMTGILAVYFPYLHIKIS